MIGSLFSGIGGLELAAERAGLGPVVWQVEIDPFCRAVLAKHWPNAERFENVRTVGAATLASVDVVVGGFPCQDISLAGRGAGLAGERSGLWFEFLRILGELRPRGVVVENVGGLARRGLDVVAGGLVDLGYTVEVSRIAAADVGAPHRRIRHFILAYAHREGQPQQGGPLGVERGRAVDGSRVADAGGVPGQDEQPRGPEQGPRGWAPVRGAAMADADRVQGRAASGPGWARPDAGQRSGVGGGACAAEPRVGGDLDGLPSGLDGPGPGGAWPVGRGEAQHEWEPPRTLAGVRNRPARLKALGNAVCPQQGYVAALRLRELLSTLSPPETP